MGNRVLWRVSPPFLPFFDFISLEITFSKSTTSACHLLTSERSLVKEPFVSLRKGRKEWIEHTLGDILPNYAKECPWVLPFIINLFPEQPTIHIFQATYRIFPQSEALFVFKHNLLFSVLLWFQFLFCHVAVIVSSAIKKLIWDKNIISECLFQAISTTVTATKKF